MRFNYQKIIKLTNRIILLVLLIVLIVLITIGLKSKDDAKHYFNDIKQQLIVERNIVTNDYLPINIKQSTISYNNQTIGTITSEDETNYYLEDGKVLSKEIGLFNYLIHHSNEITYTSYDSYTFLSQSYYIDQGESQQEVHINYQLSLDVFNQYALQVQQTMSNVFNINRVNVDFQDCQLQILIKKNFFNRYSAQCNISLMVNDNPHKMTWWF